MGTTLLTRRLCRLLLGLAWSATAWLTGCAGFFPETSSSTTKTTSTTGDFVYVVNQTSDTVSAFSVGASSLTAVAGSPYGLNSVLTAAASVAVSRANTFVYVGGQGGIACFSIASTGALTAVPAGNLAGTNNFVSLDISPDGRWLLAVDAANLALAVYSINQTTGALALNTTATSFSSVAGEVAHLARFSPSGAYAALALGPGGDIVFPFDTGTGVLSPGNKLTLTAGSFASDNALTFDAKSAFLYIARGSTSASGTSSVASYPVQGGGALGTAQTVATGNSPYAVMLDNAGTHLYTANRADGTISGFSVSNGTMVAIAGSPFPSGLTATALVEDNSNKYILAAAASGSNDLTMYGFDAIAAGKLDPVAVATSGVDPAGSTAIAATH